MSIGGPHEVLPPHDHGISKLLVMIEVKADKFPFHSHLILFS